MKSVKRLEEAQRRPLRFAAMLGLVVVLAAACGSEASTQAAAPADDRPTPDATVIAFVEAFGVGDVEAALSFTSPRCVAWIAENDMDAYEAFTAQYAVDYPEATAANIVAVTGDSDIAAISYDVVKGSGEFVRFYDSQKWVFVDGGWHQDTACPSNA